MLSLILLLVFICLLFVFCAKLSSKINPDHKLSLYITRFGIVLVICGAITAFFLLLNIINSLTL